MSGARVRTYLWRELKPIWGRLLATVITLGVAVGVFTGIYSAINGLFAHRDALYRDAAIAGHELRFVPEDAANVPDFGTLAGVGGWEPRLLLSGSFEKSKDTRVSALVIAVDPTRQRLNRPLLLEGELPAADDVSGAVIDRNFAIHHGLKPGDAITVKVGHDRLELTVRAVAIFPEYLIDGAAPGFFMPSKGSLAVLQVGEQLMRERMGFRLLNSVLFAGESAGADVSPLRVQAIESKARLTLNIDESVPLSRQFGHLYLQMDLDAFKIFTPAICAILAMACALVLAFVLRQWVNTHRSSLGVLLALGYTRASIARAWAGPLVLLLLLGLLAGLGVGWLMMKGFGMEYANAIGMPLPALALDISVFAMAAGVSAVTFAAVGVWALVHLRRTQPVDAMRELDHGQPGSRADLKMGGPLWHYPVRALLRSRAATLGTIAVIALALAPAISFFVALHSFERTIVEGLDADRWEYTVDFISPAWDDELPRLGNSLGDARVEGFARGMVRVEGNGMTESALVTGVRADSMREPKVIRGRWLSQDDHNVVLLERRVVEKLGLELGAKVSLGGTRDAYSPELIGVVSGIMPSEAYAPVTDVRQWLDLDEQNTGAMIAAGNRATLTNADLFDIDWVARVMDKDRVVQEFVKHLAEIAGILHLATLFSLLVAVLALLVSVVFAFAAREGDFALLQILGFSRRAVATMIRREIFLTGFVGVLLAVPIAMLLAHGLSALLGEAWLTVDTHYRLMDFAVVLIPSMIVLPLAAMPVVRAVRALDPAGVIRRRKFG